MSDGDLGELLDRGGRGGLGPRVGVVVGLRFESDVSEEVASSGVLSMKRIAGESSQSSGKEGEERRWK